MDENYTNDVFPLFLIKEDNNNLSEVKTTFDKTLYLSRRMECSLSEINIPNKMLPVSNKHTSKDYHVKYNYWTSTSVHSNILNNIWEAKIPNIKAINLPISDVQEQRETVKLNIFENIESFIKCLLDITNAYKIVTENFIRKYYSLPTNFSLTFEEAQIKCDHNFHIENRIGKFVLRVKKNSNLKEANFNEYDMHGRDIEYLPLDEDEFAIAAKFYFTLSKDLHELLGYDSNIFPNVRIDEITGETSSEISPSKTKKFIDKTKESDLYFVHCDIVKESLVGSIRKNILKIFPRNKHSTDENVNYILNDNLYIPLRVEEINSIKISIRNQFGEIHKFDKGKIFLTLLMRPIEYI